MPYPKFLITEDSLKNTYALNLVKNLSNTVYFMFYAQCSGMGYIYTALLNNSPHGHCRGPGTPSISGFLLMWQYCDTE